MRLENIPKPTAHSAECPTCGGPVRRWPYGEMHAGSFIRDGERVDIRGTPPAGFCDPIYLDPLTQYWDGGLYRMWPSEKYVSRGGKRLHRYVWAAAFGPIPAGCHIHHRDGDVLNNRLSNLECMPASQHLSEAWHDSRRNIPAGQHFSATAREKAAEWHASEEGRLWHSRKAVAEQSWTKWKREPKNCPQCGVEFNALVRKSGHMQIYCTSTCKVAAYRERKLGNKWAADYRERQKAQRDSGRVGSDGAGS